MKILNVSQDPQFRRTLAEKMVCPEEGVYWFTNPSTGEVKQNDLLYYLEGFVPVEDCFDPCESCYEYEIYWDLMDFPYRLLVKAYLDQEGESFEQNGDIPGWVNVKSAVEFGRQDTRFSSLIQATELEVRENAIAFAMSKILDSVEVEGED